MVANDEAMITEALTPQPAPLNLAATETLVRTATVSRACASPERPRHRQPVLRDAEGVEHIRIAASAEGELIMTVTGRDGTTKTLLDLAVPASTNSDTDGTVSARSPRTVLQMWI